VTVRTATTAPTASTRPTAVNAVLLFQPMSILPERA
jgi:hypothetical protein